MINETEESYPSIRINRSKGRITAILQGKSFMEGDQHIFYMLELNVSGYGDTLEEAKEMAKEIINGYFSEIIELSPKALSTELAKYNFKPQKMATKNYQYTGPYIDDKGFLQQFDLPEDTQVHTETLAF